MFTLTAYLYNRCSKYSYSETAAYIFYFTGVLFDLFGLVILIAAFETC